jgi:hypothetical protein
MLKKRAQGPASSIHAKRCSRKCHRSYRTSSATHLGEPGPLGTHQQPHLATHDCLSTAETKPTARKPRKIGTRIVPPLEICGSIGPPNCSETSFRPMPRKSRAAKARTRGVAELDTYWRNGSVSVVPVLPVTDAKCVNTHVVVLCSRKGRTTATNHRYAPRASCVPINSGFRRACECPGTSLPN